MAINFKWQKKMMPGCQRLLTPQMFESVTNAHQLEITMQATDAINNQLQLSPPELAVI